MCNVDVRKAIKSAGFRQYEVADELGISETTFCRWLRKEFPETKKRLVLDAIEEMKQRRFADGRKDNS